MEDSACERNKGGENHGIDKSKSHVIETGFCQNFPVDMLGRPKYCFDLVVDSADITCQNDSSQTLSGEGNLKQGEQKRNAPIVMIDLCESGTMPKITRLA